MILLVFILICWPKKQEWQDIHGEPRNQVSLTPPPKPGPQPKRARSLCGAIPPGQRPAPSLCSRSLCRGLVGLGAPHSGAHRSAAPWGLGGLAFPGKTHLALRRNEEAEHAEGGKARRTQAMEKPERTSQVDR